MKKDEEIRTREKKRGIFWRIVFACAAMRIGNGDKMFDEHIPTLKMREVLSFSAVEWGKIR